MSMNAPHRRRSPSPDGYTADYPPSQNNQQHAIQHQHQHQHHTIQQQQHQHQTSGLHHRHAVTTQAQAQAQPQSQSRLQVDPRYRERARKRRQHLPQARRGGGGVGGMIRMAVGSSSSNTANNNNTKGRWIRLALLAGIPLYLMAVTVLWFRSRYPDAFFFFFFWSTSSSSSSTTSVRTLVQLAEASHKYRQHRWMRDHEAFQQRETVQGQVVPQRAHERRERTRASATATATTSHTMDEEFIFDYEIWLPDRQKRNIVGGGRMMMMMMMETNTNASPAAVSMESLCGYLAQTAFVQNPDSYQPFSSSSSPFKVLITGILNPVGYNLALALQQRCGVASMQMIGVDAMFPNTVTNRLNLVPQLQHLVQNIPKMSRPAVLTPYIGLDPPKLPKKNMATLASSTGELDYVAAYQPSHIVHVAAAQPETMMTMKTTSKSNNNNNGKNGNINEEPQVSPLYAIRTSMAAMEQLLTSLAVNQQQQQSNRRRGSNSAAAPNTTPKLVYVSSTIGHSLQATNFRDTLHGALRLMDEILADAYAAHYGVQSIALRLPNALYGPYTPLAEKAMRLWSSQTNNNNENNNNNTGSSTTTTGSNAMAAAEEYDTDEDSLDLLHVDEVVDALLAAMQYTQPVTLDLTSGGTVAAAQVAELVQAIAARTPRPLPTVALTEHVDPVQESTRQVLAWTPRISLADGWVRTMAWYQDWLHPFAGNTDNKNGTTAMTSTTTTTGDDLLEFYQLPTCAAEDLACHAGTTYLPCISGCSSQKQCLPSMLDPIKSVLEEVTAGCDIVLYTQELGRDITDLRLHSEYMTEGEPLICNIALVSVESPLVQQVIQKVPDSELQKLGVVPNPSDQVNPGAFHKRKVTHLNGRLLFRGWILVWPEETPAQVPVTETALIKLTPSGFLSKDVQYALYIDQTFTVSPSIADIHFLVSEMRREAWPVRLVKRKTRPKAKFVLPPEPARRAVLLLSELKYQASSDAERLPSDTKISVYEATRFMRFEMGEDPLGKEPPRIKLQREFYERLPSLLNRDLMRPSSEPAHKWEFANWARTRWVLHDLQLEEARELRCDWYREEVGWQSGLDQLSLAAVLARRGLYRKLHNNEPDETIQKALSEKTGMKKLLSDTFEWDALETEANKQYSPYEEMKILPYEIDYEVEEPEENIDAEKPAQLFVRVMSDRIMSFARKTYNDKKELAEIEKKIREQEAQEKAAAETAQAEAEAAQANAGLTPEQAAAVDAEIAEEGRPQSAGGLRQGDDEDHNTPPQLSNEEVEEHNVPPLLEGEMEEANVPETNEQKVPGQVEGGSTEQIEGLLNEDSGIAEEGAGPEVAEHQNVESAEGNNKAQLMVDAVKDNPEQAEEKGGDAEQDANGRVDGVAPPDQVNWDFDHDNGDNAI